MKISEYFKKYLKKIPKSKTSILMVVGIIGLMLILVSSFSSGEKLTKNESQVFENKTSDTETYTTNLEKRLEGIISDMLGGTKVSVMITLESGTEYVYANEVKVDAGVKKDQAALKTEQNDSNQKTYVVIKDSDGNEQALIITEKMPVVRGVVVVCQSGQTDAVSSAVKVAVKSALNIDEEKICVIGRY